MQKGINNTVQKLDSQIMFLLEYIYHLNCYEPLDKIMRLLYLARDEASKMPEKPALPLMVIPTNIISLEIQLIIAGFDSIESVNDFLEGLDLNLIPNQNTSTISIDTSESEHPYVIPDQRHVVSAAEKISLAMFYRFYRKDLI